MGEREGEREEGCDDYIYNEKIYCCDVIVNTKANESFSE
jgi:hypothetical protein